MVQIVDATRDRRVALAMRDERGALLLIARVSLVLCRRMLVDGVVSMTMGLGLVIAVVRGLMAVVRRLMVVLRRRVPVRMVRGPVSVRRLLRSPGLGHNRLPVLMRRRDRSMVMVAELRVERDVQTGPELESDQPQRAQEQRVNSAKAAAGKERHGRERNRTRVSTTIRTPGPAGSAYVFIPGPDPFRLRTCIGWGCAGSEPGASRDPLSRARADRPMPRSRRDATTLAGFHGDPAVNRLSM